MRYIAFDTETALIKDSLLVPPVVCLSVCDNGAAPRLYVGSDIERKFTELLDEALAGRAVLVGHNVAFDTAVLAEACPQLMAKIFATYDADGIVDTQVCEKMLDIFDGQLQRKYSLAHLCMQYMGVELDKGDDGWRLRYYELRDTPLDQWPKRAAEYARDDAKYTFLLHQAQLERAGRGMPKDVLHNLPEQARAAFGLHLMAAWGIRTDGKHIKTLEYKLQAARDTAHAKLAAGGLLNPRGGRSIEAIRERIRATSRPPYRLTDTGKISTAGEVLEGLQDPLLKSVVEYAQAEKLLNTYVTKLWRGTKHAIQPYVNTLLYSGRTSMGNPNLQNVPTFAGIREAYVPRPGHVFCTVDYDTAELRSLAQTCLDLFGFSKMAEAFQENPKADLHTMLAARIVGVPFEEAMERKKQGKLPARKLAKELNFGLPGGMGVKRFIATVQKKGLEISHGEASRHKATWLQQWPEMKQYFKHISQVTEGDGLFQSFISKRYRGGCGYCDGANNYFQSRTADGAKRAVYAVVKKMYTQPTNPLYGCRLVLFLHDELIIEAPEEHAHEAAEELTRVMIEQMQTVCPDVPITAEPALMRRWYKGAEAVYDKSGKLIPWEPQD